MSLYDHFASKNELLAAMADAVVVEVLVPEPLPADWRQAMSAIARHSYAAFVGHPWLPGVFSNKPRFGPNSVKVAEQAAQATGSLDIEPGKRWLMHGTLNDYVLGHSIRPVALARPKDLEDMIPAEELARSPEIAYLRSRASLEPFEIGLETVLDGIEGRFLGRE